MSGAERLRVLVDGSAAFNQGAGIGRYARHVVPAAARLLPEADFTLFYAPARAGAAPFADQTVALFPREAVARVRRAPLSRRRIDQLWFRLRVPLPVQLVGGRADVVYSPDFTAPPAGRAPRVMTIHDLAFLIHPELAPVPLRRYLEAVVPRQVRTASLVVCVSEATRHDVCERLAVPEERVRVVPNGVDERFFAASPLPPAERERLGLPEAYFLTVGTIEPRKNHRGLFEAMDLLWGPVDLPLVVAGRRGWGDEPIVAEAARLAAAGRVVLLDYVPDALLPGLYAGAAALVYPSWHEGFGLPVIEALACGTPVVASTAPALRETGGPVATYVSAGRPEEIAAAMSDALSSEAQAPAARQKRRIWARGFSWERAGEALAEVLRMVAGVDPRA